MLKIGITGGIGSGKTTVCRIFETFGIPVYYADDRAKWLMQHDPKLINSITELFGESVYLPDGKLNRQLLASIIFNDRAKLMQLESLVHPRVHEDGIEWHEAQKNVPYTLKEAALLFESGSYKFMDKTVTVTAPLELRIARVISRDQTSREAVMARIDKQIPEEQKISLADYVIHNDMMTGLIKQVNDLHKVFCALAKG